MYKRNDRDPPITRIDRIDGFIYRPNAFLLRSKSYLIDEEEGKDGLTPRPTSL